MDTIALASSEQMQGISQVSVAVSQMDGVTQNNAALVEESSSASQSLSEQAHALRGMVEAFRV
jgi:methyl-accepting chemotaxis protein